MTDDHPARPAENPPDRLLPPEPLPPDPDAYDSPRAVQARKRGLKTAYIPGGTDPDPEGTQRRERRYLWLLVAMIVVLVLAGYVLGFIAQLFGG